MLFVLCLGLFYFSDFQSVCPLLLHLAGLSSKPETTSCQVKILFISLNCLLSLSPWKNTWSCSKSDPSLYILGLTLFWLLNYLEFLEWTKMLLVFYVYYSALRNGPSLNLSGKHTHLLKFIYIPTGNLSCIPLLHSSFICVTYFIWQQVYNDIFLLLV